MRHQRSVAHNPQRKAKRLKTEQLPLETIPCYFQTCALLLTLTADPCRLAHLLTSASEFDAYLVDGKLRGAFKGGAGPEETAMLVKPLLARIGDGPTRNQLC